MQLPAFDVNPAPNYWPGLADASQGASTQAEIHGRLAPAGRRPVSDLEVRGGNGSGNQEYPNVLVDALACIMLPPTDIVQRIVSIHPEQAPQMVGEQDVQPSTFVHLVEMGDGLAGEQFLAVVAQYGRVR